MKSLRQLILLSFAASILIVGKVVLAIIPNIEIVTFLLIIYTLAFGFQRTFIITIVYTFTEFIIWGFGVQLLIWPLIVLVTALVKRVFKDNFILWSLYSGLWGLIFGFLCAILLFYFGLLDKSALSGYLILNIPFDAAHMIGNYLIMLFIGKVVYNRLKSLLNANGGML